MLPSGVWQWVKELTTGLRQGTAEDFGADVVTGATEGQVKEGAPAL